MQTIVGYYFPANKRVGPTFYHKIFLPDGDALILCENRPDSRTPKGAVLLMHGLGGEASSPYMLRCAAIFKSHGWLVFRLNHRGCGEGRGLARQIYNAGRSEDVSQTLVKIWDLYSDLPIIAVGFSLSGNMLLKLLGEDRHPIPSNLRGAISVNAPIDLAACADSICQKRNWIYNHRFVRMLKDTIQQRQRDFPDFPRIKFPRLLSLRKFDDLCTAPLSGYADADDYYKKCSANQFLQNITIPAWLLMSDDDPFIPVQVYYDLPASQSLKLHLTHGGGHMGYVAARKTPLGNHLWLDYAVLFFAEKLLQKQPVPSTFNTNQIIR